MTYYANCSWLIRAAATMLAYLPALTITFEKVEKPAE